MNATTKATARLEAELTELIAVPSPTKYELEEIQTIKKHLFSLGAYGRFCTPQELG